MGQDVDFTGIQANEKGLYFSAVLQAFVPMLSVAFIGPDFELQVCRQVQLHVYMNRGLEKSLLPRAL